MRTILNRDNAVRAYLWLEMIFLSFLILVTSLYIHFALIPLVGILIAIRLKNDIAQFYRFMYTFTFGIFIIEVYVYIRDQAYIIGTLGLCLSVIFFLLLKREEMCGRTLWVQLI